MSPRSKDCPLRIGLLVTAGVLLFAGAGCRDADTIQRYRIPKEPAVQSASPDLRAPHGSAVDQRPARILAAMVPHGARTWFFKITGESQQVAEKAEAFREFVKSIRLAGNDAEPKWTLPAGWRQQPEAGSSMRFATLEIGSEDRPLELTVIPLGSAPGTEPSEYALMNVNRWREQLGLPAIEEDEMAKQSEQIELPNGTATLVNFEGKLDANTRGMGPFAPAKRRVGPEPANRKKSTALTYEVPEGWQEVPAASMSKASFRVTSEQGAAEITVTDLPRRAGERLPNINRWREQIGLEATSPQELANELQKVPIGNLSGDFIELVGPAGATPRESILGVIAEHGGKAWFVKLRGDPEVADRERDRFRAFVRSIKFRDSDGAGDGN